MTPSTDTPEPLSRPRGGRWLGGVCAGLAARWNRPPAHVRAGFLLAAALFGLGAIAYVAAWLIVPGEGEEGAGAGRRGVVVLAQVCGAALGLGTLAVAGALATIFGFGWVVVALAGAVLLGTLLSWPRVGPAWTLLLVGALALPSAAMAMGGLRISPRTAPTVVAPRTVADLPARALRSGLGDLEVDLRHTSLPTSGSIPLRIRAGVSRTIVALPHDRCVHVDVRRRELPFAIRAGSVLVGAGSVSEPGATLFGMPADAPASRGRRRGATLRIDFASSGGELIVRDYPDDVFPSEESYWPENLWPYAEPARRPRTKGLPRATARRRLARWRARRERQAEVRRLLPGPCAVEARR
jgi:phage shock protein PspC (stress-responsive transcriptional regulator)